MASDNAFLAALSGERRARPPIWLMRQAGRYLEEYRELRTRAPTFLEFCFTPALAVEATLQPIRRFGFDAAILFSDILVMPDALGQTVAFESGEGPRLQAVESAADLMALRETPDFSKLEPVFETVQRLRAALPTDVALIGFCGAPWTVASYMIAGRGTPDQAPARLFAYREPELFRELINRLIAGSADYLIRQIRAGAQAVQIFDSWAGSLPPLELERWSVAPLREICARVRKAEPDARIIVFPRAVGSQISAYADLEGICAIGLDTSANAALAGSLLPPKLALQGNLDPLALIAGGAALDAAIDRVVLDFAGRPHVFNLGHGILPQTPVAHVERLVRRVREG